MFNIFKINKYITNLNSRMSELENKIDIYKKKEKILEKLLKNKVYTINKGGGNYSGGIIKYIYQGNDSILREDWYVHMNPQNNQLNNSKIIDIDTFIVEAIQYKI